MVGHFDCKHYCLVQKNVAITFNLPSRCHKLSMSLPRYNFKYFCYRSKKPIRPADRVEDDGSWMVGQAYLVYTNVPKVEDERICPICSEMAPPNETHHPHYGAISCFRNQSNKTYFTLTK